jgi:hypothetical protein
MPVTINGTTGIVSPGVDSTNLILDGSTSGSITLLAPAVAGSNTQTLVAATGTLAPLIADTAKSATSTSVDFTGIPSWVKRITVMFSGVSTNGTSNARIQIGDSGGIETTGYAGTNTTLQGTGPNSANFTAGFDFLEAGNASSVRNGVLFLCNVSGNSWAASGQLGLSDVVRFTSLAGVKTLSDVLTQVRITTVNGTDTFDAGTINILYE